MHKIIGLLLLGSSLTFAVEALAGKTSPVEGIAKLPSIAFGRFRRSLAFDANPLLSRVCGFASNAKPQQKHPGIDRTDSVAIPSVGYEKLSISDNERQIIYQIIDTLGTSGLLKLYRKEDDLVEIGGQIQHVHPLRFLEVVLTDPHLKQCMVNVEDSYFKWKGFVKGSGKTPGFIAKCEREFARDNFAPYIVEFCQAVDANPAQVGALIERRKWEKLVRSLIHK